MEARMLGAETEYCQPTSKPLCKKRSTRRRASIIRIRASSGSDEKALGPNSAIVSTTLTQMAEGKAAHSLESMQAMLALVS